MAVTVAAVRQRVAAALETTAGWTESGAVGGPQWAGTGEGEQAQSGRFAVTTPSTAAYDSTDAQHVPLRGAVLLASTEVRIDWRYRLRADAQVGDYDAAMTQEHALRVSLGSVDATGGVRVYESLAIPPTREVIQDEQGHAIAVRGILTLAVIHPFARS